MSNNRLRKLANNGLNVSELIEKVPEVKLGYYIKDAIANIDTYEFMEFVEADGRYSHADQMLYDTPESMAYVIGIAAFKRLEGVAENLYNTLKSEYNLEGTFDQEVREYLNIKVDNLDKFANVGDLSKDVVLLINETTELQEELEK